MNCDIRHVVTCVILWLHVAPCVNMCEILVATMWHFVAFCIKYMYSKNKNSV